jgi:hypothetical protein
MTVAGIVNEIHEILAQKKPKGTSEYAILAKVIDSFIPKSKARISEEKAREIVLARGALARKRLEQAEGGAISAEEVADLLGLSRQGVDYLRKQNGSWPGALLAENGTTRFGNFTRGACAVVSRNVSRNYRVMIPGVR